eukprot:TRINITY_DN21459_c0_g1::TRINITY_DN21459_c0_g1_i1::g.10044::m.10044 TRINITY_DN21459_c0_g1::TRINITY_DN21459_c0_g1_i1::g.10044  ORF type:complete len:139 (+),score=16.61,FYVE/PF01363.16/3.3e-05,FYVE_2/PF02318.11/0.076,FYVE_2/PF02318.11/9.9e+02,Siva/PF05458.7/0.92,Siva/PF05458.7/6.9e+02 TRINITY_DN21459_c0_g1_i1:111-527(+)
MPDCCGICEEEFGIFRRKLSCSKCDGDICSDCCREFDTFAGMLCMGLGVESELEDLGVSRGRLCLYCLRATKKKRSLVRGSARVRAVYVRVVEAKELPQRPEPMPTSQSTSRSSSALSVMRDPLVEVRLNDTPPCTLR